MPILHSPGVIIPGQFGPIRRALVLFSRYTFTSSISKTGIPSVIHTIKEIPASAASKIESLQNGAIISGGKGTAAEKFKALEKAGVRTVRSPAELGDAIAEQTGWK